MDWLMEALVAATRAAWDKHRAGAHVFGGPRQDDDWPEVADNEHLQVVIAAAVAEFLRRAEFLQYEPEVAGRGDNMSGDALAAALERLARQLDGDVGR